MRERTIGQRRDTLRPGARGGRVEERVGRRVRIQELRDIRVRRRSVELIRRARGTARTADHRLSGRTEHLRRPNLTVRGVEVEFHVLVDRRIELRERTIDVVLFNQIVVRNVIVRAGRDARRNAVRVEHATNCFARRVGEVADQASGWQTKFAVGGVVRRNRQRAARQPRGDVGQRRPRRGVHAIGASGPVALFGFKARAMLVFGRPHEVDVVVADAAKDGKVVVAIRARDRLVLGADFEANEVIARDEVDHAAGGVGAVDHGRAVFQNFGAGQGGGRDVRGVLAHAAAVQQDKGLVGAEAAKVVLHRAGELGAGEIVGFAGGGAGDRQALGELERGRRALFFKFFLREDLDGQSRVFRRALDERAGHDDAVAAGIRFSFGRRLSDGLYLCEGRKGSRQTNQNRSAGRAAEHELHSCNLPV